jgi:SAM-dependent methyltransferase
MSIYQSIMGRAWVYDRIRPLMLGGFDFSAVYGWLQCTPEDIVVDIGCGTGHAMEYLGPYKTYHGFDIDQHALDTFRLKHPERTVDLEARIMGREDLDRLAPTRAIAMGLLHHLTDAEARDLMDMLSACKSMQRIITLDPVFLPGRRLNNLLVRMDRGKFGRDRDGYRNLAKNAGLTIAKDELVHSGNRVCWYQAMCLTRGNTAGA